MWHSVMESGNDIAIAETRHIWGRFKAGLGRAPNWRGFEREVATDLTLCGHRCAGLAGAAGARAEIVAEQRADRGGHLKAVTDAGWALHLSVLQGRQAGSSQKLLRPDRCRHRAVPKVCAVPGYVELNR